MRVRRVAAVLAACLTVWLLVLAVLVRLGGEAETVAPPRSVPTATGGEAGTGEGAVAATQIHGIPKSLVERLQASTVQVRGLDCRIAQFGTGFVVGPDLIATGAHVVAGITAPIVRLDGAEISTRVVAFDPVSDLALLRPTGDVVLPRALELGYPAAGVMGVVLAHDDDGVPVVLSMVVDRLIRATGEDIYGRPGGGRDALELFASIRSGHSGAPVVDGDGLVLGVLFSRLRGGGPVAYAVQSSELALLVDGLDDGERAAGPCR